MKARLAAISVLGAALVVAVNVLTKSYLNFYYWSGARFAKWEWFVSHILDLHRTQVATFARRPVTTFAVDQLVPLLGSWWAFVAVQFFFLAAGAFSLQRVASIFAFFASFTVLFSFVTPNDAYDEAAQYLFLFLALRSEKAMFSFWFFLALVTRETSLVLIPGFFLMRKEVPYLFAPVLLYGASLLFLGTGDDPQRFHYWAKNFQDFKTTGETVVSLFLALSLPLALCREKGTNYRAFLLSAIVNTPLVCATAYARETRLFALPLIFLWPVCEWRLHLPSSWRQGVLSGALALALAFLYSPSYRSALAYRACAVFFALFLAFRDTSSQESISPG